MSKLALHLIMPVDDEVSLIGERGQVLLDAIQRRKCVLLLGPGVAVDPKEANGKLLTERLAEELAGKLDAAKKSHDLVSRSDLAHVAQVYEREMPLRRPGLEFATKGFYTPYLQSTTQLHIDLAALPFTLGISTTPDRFLLNAFKKTPDKKPIYQFYRFQPDPTRAREHALPVSPPEDDPEKSPLVYDLYGNLDETDSLVLTENDMLDFLVSVARQLPPIHPYVSGQFSDPNVSFLFLGFGFRHWYVRILLHVLKAAGHKVPSLALEESAFFKLPGHAETALFFESGHLLTFQELPWTNFAAELRSVYEAQKPAIQQAQDTARQLPDDAPTAFLCHENRDKEEAVRIGRRLQDKGIKIWLDKQNLRGGDRWADLIPNVLEKICNYVVVLQSRHMLDKSESYFWKEIKFSLDRQNGFANDRRFIIPALLEANPNLPLGVLKGLQWVDLTTDAGIEALAETIQEDWKKRPERSAAHA